MNNRVIIVTPEKEMGASFDALLANLQGRVYKAEVVGITASQSELFNQFAEAATSGVEQVVIIPLSIPRNYEMTKMINNCVNSLFDSDSNIRVTVINDYLSETIVEDQIWETITAKFTDGDDLPELGKNIETLSHVIIDSKLKNIKNLSVKEKIVARRVIHATADYSFANTLHFSEGAVNAGIAALREKKPIICDVNMLKTAMTHVGEEIICAISEPDVVEMAKRHKCTRAAAAMMKLQDKLDGAIIVVGNAPTAIWQLLKMDVKPALVVGLPVGFVGARESKIALINSERCCIANNTPRGGSPAAAAAMNALALLARE